MIKFCRMCLSLPVASIGLGITYLAVFLARIGVDFGRLSIGIYGDKLPEDGKDNTDNV